jgi:uncharacterized membrane protein YhaH (DUF805 family)
MTGVSVQVLFALMGVFFMAFALALLPLLVAAAFEESWKHGAKRALLGFDADSFGASRAASEVALDGKTALSLWPHGETGTIGFGGAISRGYVGWQDYTGRATRGEFWWWYLYTLLASAIGGGLVAGLASLFGLSTNSTESSSGWGGLFVGLVAALVGAIFLSTILPTIAVMVRRLHDSGKSGWWLLLYLVPLGAIVLLVFFVTKGTVGDNRYGADRLSNAPSMESIPA